MHQEQAEVNKHQLGALHVQMEEQTQLQQLQLLSQGQGHHLSLLIRPQLSCYTNWRQRMTFLNKLNLPTLSKEIADNLNALITQEELTKALNHMPNNKSPGLDGFPNKLSSLFHRAALEIKSTSTIPTHMNKDPSS